MNDNIFKRDYKIEIAFDINGLPHWSLYRKGISIVANDEQEEMICEAFSELKEKLDNKPIRNISCPEDIKKVCQHKGITFIPHHACAICREFTGWYLFGRWPGMEVAYSSSCECSYHDSARPESWNDIFEWVTDEHGELRPEYKDMLTE